MFGALLRGLVLAAVCVSGLVEGLPEEKARHYLRDLWGFLRTWASGEGPETLQADVTT